MACGPTDFFCQGGETVQKWIVDAMREALTWMFDWTSLTTESAMWKGSIEAFQFWGGVVMIFIVIIAAAIEFTRGALLQQQEIVLRALVWTGISTPVLILTIWFLGNLLDVLDLLPAEIVKAAIPDDGSVEEFIGRMFLGANPQWDLETIKNGLSSAGSGAQMIFWHLIGLLCAGISITIVDAVRTVAIVILIAFAPLVFPLLSTGFGKKVATGWGIAIVAALMTKPLAVGIVGALLLGAKNLDSMWTMEGLPFTIGLAMIAFVPMTLLSVLSFFAQEIDHGARQASSGALRLGAGAFRRGVGAMRGMQGNARMPSTPTPSGGQGSGGGKPASPSPAPSPSPSGTPSPSGNGAGGAPGGGSGSGSGGGSSGGGRHGRRSAPAPSGSGGSGGSGSPGSGGSGPSGGPGSTGRPSGPGSTPPPPAPAWQPSSVTPTTPRQHPGGAGQIDRTFGSGSSRPATPPPPRRPPGPNPFQPHGS